MDVKLDVQYTPAKINQIEYVAHADAVYEHETDNNTKMLQVERNSSQQSVENMKNRDIETGKVNLLLSTDQKSPEDFKKKVKDRKTSFNLAIGSEFVPAMFNDALTKRISPGGLAERRSMIKPSNLIFAQNEPNFDDEQLTPLSNRQDDVGQMQEAMSKDDIRFGFLGKQQTQGKSNKSIIKFSQNSNIDVGECMSHNCLDDIIFEQQKVVV